MGDVEPHESGLASGLVNTSFMMGGALGLAVLVGDLLGPQHVAAGRRRRPGRRGARRLPARLRRRRGLRAAGRGRRRGLPAAAADGDAGRDVRRARRGRLPRPGLTRLTVVRGHPPTVARMTSFLLRSARVVELGEGTAHGPAARRARARRPGRRGRPGPRPSGRARGARRRGTLAGAGPVGPARAPRPVDRHLAAPRPRADPLGRGRPRAGRRAPDRGARRTGHRLGPPPLPLGPRPDRHRARRRRARHPGRADQRRRPPRLAQLDGAGGPRAPVARHGRRRVGVVRGVRPPGHRRRQRRHLARRLPAHAWRPRPRWA